MQNSPCCVTNETKTSLSPAPHYQNNSIPIPASRGPVSTYTNGDIFYAVKIVSQGYKSIVSKAVDGVEIT